ncbi:MAG: ion transporter [Eubacterium sp.]|nr:ion transporter [Eubacterium sp.]
MSKKRVFEILEIGNKNDRISSFFDYFLTVVIILNIAVMFLMTFDCYAEYMPIFKFIEIITMWIFVAEYALRIWTSEYLYPEENKRRAAARFVLSADGIIELLTILPFFFLSGFVAFRMLRVVRIFHLFRINPKTDSLSLIGDVIWEKKDQIFSSVLIIIILMMASSICMYSAEHEAQPEAFKNAFSGIWWSVSAMLTIGYGDIYPITFAGKILAIIVAFLGVGVVAIPTGIISAGFVEHYARAKSMAYISRESDLQFITITIDQKHNWKDRSLRDIQPPQGLVIAFIQRDEEAIIPKGDVVLREGDELVFGAKNFGKEQLGVSLKEIEITEGHEWIGHAIREIDISKKTNIVAIKRSGRSLMPNGNTVIKANDTLIIFTRK